MSFLNSTPDAIAIYGDHGLLSKLGDVSASYSDGQLKIRAESTPLSFVRLRWNHALPQGTRFCGDAWERTYGDSCWSGFDASRMMPWYFFAQLPSDGGVVACGVKVRPGAFAAWSADPAGITLWCDLRCGSCAVQLGGRTLDVVEVVSTKYTGICAYAAAGRFCAALCSDPRLPAAPVYGSNNWYYAYGDITEESVLEDCRLLAELTAGLENRPFMVIDDGWQELRGKCTDNYGPWRKGNAHFPDMAGLPAKMKAHGVRPGIWYRPLYINDDSLDRALFLNGRPFTLDPSHPDALKLVAEDITRLRDWGFELVKHDFTTYDATGHYAFDMHPWPCSDSPYGGQGTWAFHDRTRTTAEILVGLFRTIREAAGPVFIMGCNVIGHLAAGLQELSRTGDDTSGRRWDRTRKMGVNTVAFRACQHRTFFEMDADCVGITGAIPWSLNRQWARLVAASGSSLFVSPRPGVLDDAEKAELKALMAVAAKGVVAAEPLDWQDNACPEHWRINGVEQRFSWYENEGGEPDFVP